ncbi:hypothetical protein ACQR3P_28570 [Rhodococcus sp. IEGM1300]
MAIQLKIGLAPKKVSYFDQKTNLYLTLEEPFKTVSLPDTADLSGLARGLFTMNPAIVILEGVFPEDAKQAFKDRYEHKFAVHTRTDRLVSLAQPFPEVTPEAPTDPEEPITGQSVSEPDLFSPDMQVEEKPAVKKTTTAKKTTTKKTEA